MTSGFIALDRRNFLASLGSAAAGLALSGSGVSAASSMITRPVAVTGATLPVIGMGTWITFNVGQSRSLRAARTEVLKRFFELGGGLVDSSPMYGSSEEVVGHALREIGAPGSLYSATKVWTSGRQNGIAQMRASETLWDSGPFNLMQIHNMLDWQVHYETLSEWKSDGRIGAIGITTSHGRRHADLAGALQNKAFDFVQLTYNLLDREAENRLLPIARERNIAVIINRPFQRGGLFDHVQGHKVPDWAQEFDCRNWAQFFLKYVVSHPAVTCAIPATSQLDHMTENMGAGHGALPDAKTRERMARHVRDL